MKMRFLVDEDLPRSTAKALSAAGYEAFDVRDVGLRGARDRDILAYARQNKMTVVTADVGLVSLAYLSSAEHSGLVLLRLPPELPVKTVNEILLKALCSLSPEEITSSIVVVDQEKIRIRSKNGV